MTVVAFQLEAVENGIQLLTAGAQVEQRGDRHVARNARRALKVKDV